MPSAQSGTPAEPEPHRPEGPSRWRLEYPLPVERPGEAGEAPNGYAAARSTGSRTPGAN